jgi:hypothetical protein
MYSKRQDGTEVQYMFKRRAHRCRQCAGLLFLKVIYRLVQGVVFSYTLLWYELVIMSLLI